jgi:hypothetical protein
LGRDYRCNISTTERVAVAIATITITNVTITTVTITTVTVTTVDIATVTVTTVTVTTVDIATVTITNITVTTVAITTVVIAIATSKYTHTAVSSSIFDIAICIAFTVTAIASVGVSFVALVQSACHLHPRLPDV